MNNLTCGSNESRRDTLKYVRRVLLYSVIMTVCVALLTAQSGKITSKDQKSAEAITAAITALGGEKNIDNIKSLILTGTTKYYSTNRVDETEIRILLPDNYLRIVKTVYGTTLYDRASKDLSQNAAFDETGNPMPTSQTNEVNRFACLLLGLLLKGDPATPPTISAVAGTSGRFGIATETGSLGEMEFDPARKYPLLISYKDTVREIVTEREENIVQGKISGFIKIGPGPEKLVDSIMRFNDRFSVEGVMFPGTIVFESQGKAVRELNIKNIQINPKLTPADLEIPNFPAPSNKFQVR